MATGQTRHTVGEFIEFCVSGRTSDMAIQDVDSFWLLTIKLPFGLERVPSSQCSVSKAKAVLGLPRALASISTIYDAQSEISLFDIDIIY